MTDRELAGCAQVMRYYHSADGISTMDPDDGGPWVAWTDYADLLAKYEELLSRAPSRDAEDAARWRWAKRHFRVMGLEMSGQHHWVTTAPFGRVRGPTIDTAIDAAIAAAERENHG